MLPPREKKLTCAICNTESEYWIGDRSHSNFGQPDLDLRPPEMGRWIIERLVQRCSTCGYCASEIDFDTQLQERSEEELEEFVDDTGEVYYLNFKFDEYLDDIGLIVYSSAYKAQLNDPNYPEMANSFLCAALIETALDDCVQAIWHTMNACWICDDKEKNNAAKSCRSKAFALIEIAHSKNLKVIQGDESDAPLRVDLLRRTGKFKEAQEIIFNELPKIKNDRLIQILNYQKTLIESKDDKCHRIPSDDNDYE